MVMAAEALFYKSLFWALSQCLHSLLLIHTGELKNTAQDQYNEYYFLGTEVKIRWWSWDSNRVFL